MPPKKEEGPHPTVIKSARNSIAGVNNAVFSRSLQGLKKTATKNAIVKAYKNTLKRNANEKVAAAAAEHERTGGIDLQAIFSGYKEQWDSLPYTLVVDPKTRQKYRKLSPEHQKLINNINKYLEGASEFSVGLIETNTSAYYAERAIASDIISGKYDSVLPQMKAVVERDGYKVIAEDNGKNLLHMISLRESRLKNSAPGGGAGTAGGARRRRRRTHKRKATRRRKTHRRH